jgi:predicted lipoprotein with Yx(FWY)xxD motif
MDRTTFRGRPLPILALAVAVAAVAACGRKDNATRDTTTSTGVVAVDSTAPPAAVAVATPAGAPLALTVAAKPGEAVYLTDANGRAVYFLDTPDGKPIVSCEGDCAAAFDPVTGKAIVATGDTTVKVALIGDVARPNGSTQATYNGRPLYYYKNDQAPGETKGAGVKASGGSASLVAPDGKHAGTRSGTGKAR